MGYYFVPPVRQQEPTSPGAARGYWPLDFSRVSLELSPTGRVSVGTLSTQASRVRKQIVMIVEHRSAAISKMAASRTIVPPELRSGIAFNFVVGTEVRILSIVSKILFRFVFKILFRHVLARAWTARRRLSSRALLRVCVRIF